MKKIIVRIVLAIIVVILLAWTWYATQLPRQRPARRHTGGADRRRISSGDVISP